VKLPDSIKSDTAEALSIVESNLSATWHLSAANMLEDIAKRIREQVANQPSPEFPPVE
jgi:hypothetical protein